MGHPPGMRSRRTRLVVACAALGTLTTVLTAWAIALISDPEIRPLAVVPASSVGRPGFESHASIGERIGTVQIAVFDFSTPLSGQHAQWLSSLRAWDFSPRTSTSDWTVLVASRSAGAQATVARAYGFPLRCLSCRHERTESNAESRSGALRVRAARIPQIYRDFAINQIYPLDGCLPLRPHSRGVLVNSLFYAMFWLPVLLIVPPQVARARQRLRAWRVARHMVRTNSCPHCRYPLAGLQRGRCPECGTDLE